MEHLDYLITGTGRCGTGFIANLLKSVDVPCGHEALFGLGGLEQARKSSLHNSHLKAEASWLAAPFIKHLPENILVIHLVRDPLKVIASALKLRACTGALRDYLRFSYKYLPEMALFKDDITQIAFRYVEWNEMITRQIGDRSSVWWRVEDRPEEFLDLLRIDRENRTLFSNTQYNTKYGGKVNIVLGNVADEKVREDLKRMAERYGYDC